MSNDGKEKINWFGLLVVFSVAILGAFFSQMYVKNTISQKTSDNIERLSYENTQSNTENSLIESESVIEKAMKSVVGISKLQANEESIFDVALSEKWGMRYRYYCF